MRENYTKILTGRLHKIETLQAKLSNLMAGRVVDGVLPSHIREGLNNPEIRAKLKNKIDKAERLKLNIAIAIYDDII